MKKLIFFMMISFTLLLCSCQYTSSTSQNEDSTEQISTEEITTEAKVDLKPNITEIRSICNLATLE